VRPTRYRFRIALSEELGGLHAAAPGTRQHTIERQSARPESFAGAARLGPAGICQIALAGTIVEPIARRIAEPAWRRRVAHENHVARLAQQGPGIGLRERGGLARNEKQGRQQRQAKPDAAWQPRHQLWCSGKNSIPSSRQLRVDHRRECMPA